MIPNINVHPDQTNLLFSAFKVRIWENFARSRNFRLEQDTVEQPEEQCAGWWREHWAEWTRPLRVVRNRECARKAICGRRKRMFSERNEAATLHVEPWSTFSRCGFHFEMRRDGVLGGRHERDCPHHTRICASREVISRTRRVHHQWCHVWCDGIVFCF